MAMSKASNFTTSTLALLEALRLTIPIRASKLFDQSLVNVIHLRILASLLNKIPSAEAITTAVLQLLQLHEGNAHTPEALCQFHHQSIMAYPSSYAVAQTLHLGGSHSVSDLSTDCGIGF